jgi:hypothetical protein
MIPTEMQKKYRNYGPKSARLSACKIRPIIPEPHPNRPLRFPFPCFFFPALGLGPALGGFGLGLGLGLAPAHIRMPSAHSPQNRLGMGRSSSEPPARRPPTPLVGAGWLVIAVGGALAVVGGRCSSFRRPPPTNSGSNLKGGGGPLDDPLRDAVLRELTTDIAKMIPTEMQKKYRNYGPVPDILYTPPYVLEGACNRVCLTSETETQKGAHAHAHARGNGNK